MKFTDNTALPASTSRRIRVCFVIENLIHAGTEKWIVRLIDRLDRHLVEPHLCIIDGRSRVSRALEPSQCGILRLGIPNLKSARSLTAAAAFYRYLRRHGIDVVQVHHADPTYFGVPVAKLAGVRWVLQTKYDVGYWLKGLDLWMHRLMRRWIDITVANCEACRWASIQQEWSPENQVHVVDNGIPLTTLATVPDLQDKDFQGEVNIGIVANLRPVKDHATLLRAARIVLRNRPDTTFHLAGDGELRDDLEQLCEELGIKDRVRFHGHIDNTAQFLAKLTICVLCSTSEGLPHSLLEYMAAGRSVVATRVGGNREVVIDRRTGRLVSPSDPNELSQAILDLLFNPDAAMCQARAGRASVIDRFGLDVMARRFELFYQQLFEASSVVDKTHIHCGSRTEPIARATDGQAVAKG